MDAAHWPSVSGWKDRDGLALEASSRLALGLVLRTTDRLFLRDQPETPSSTRRHVAAAVMAPGPVLETDSLSVQLPHGGRAPHSLVRAHVDQGGLPLPDGARRLPLGVPGDQPMQGSLQPVKHSLMDRDGISPSK